METYHKLVEKFNLAVSSKEAISQQYETIHAVGEVFETLMSIPPQTYFLFVVLAVVAKAVHFKAEIRKGE